MRSTWKYLPGLRLLKTSPKSGHTLSFKHSSNGKISTLIVYVDDIILTGDYKEEIRQLKKILAAEFEIKDL